MNPLDKYRDFPWPCRKGEDVRPKWNGNEFLIGNERTSFLDYSSTDVGWSSELTTCHESATDDGHFIDIASRKCAARLLGKFLGKGKDPLILELGSSSGFFVRDLLEFMPLTRIIASDIIKENLLTITHKFPSVPTVRLDINDCPFSEGAFDAVVALNVLEHIENDFRALENIKRILRPGGILVFEVPSGPGIYDVYDEYLRHFRRYRKGDLIDFFNKLEFKIIWMSHLGFFLYPAFWVIKKINRLRYRHKKPQQKKNIVQDEIKRSNFSLPAFIQGMESALLQEMSLPWGIRVVGCVRK